MNLTGFPSRTELRANPCLLGKCPLDQMMQRGQRKTDIRRTTQGAPWSWKVIEFRKTISQAWKVIENSEGRGKSWKMIMSCNFYNCADTNYEP